MGTRDLMASWGHRAGRRRRTARHRPGQTAGVATRSRRSRRTGGDRPPGDRAIRRPSTDHPYRTGEPVQEGEPRVSTPTPHRERWQPLRAGLVDLFYYDVEEF